MVSVTLRNRVFRAEFYSHSIIKTNVFHSTGPGLDLGFLLFSMPGKGPKSQYHRSTGGGTAAVPPRTCSSCWYCPTTLPTCGNAEKE